MKTNVKSKSAMLALCDFRGWSEQAVREHIASSYGVSLGELNRFRFLIAHECEDCYEGYAHLLLEEKSNGKLFANYASHCSCFGYEGQFDPEETTVEFLMGPHAGGFYKDPEVVDWMKQNFKSPKNHLTNAEKCVQ